jgi:serine/threonine-protein kinase
MADLDATRDDRGAPVDRTEVAAAEGTASGGTEAATPKAIVAHASQGPGASQTPQQSTRATGPSAGEAFDRSELKRARAFHMFGVLASGGTVPMTLYLGGDPTMRLAFWIGISILAASNVALWWMTYSAERYKPRPVGILWVTSSVGILPSLLYFGPFSSAVQVLMLGIVFAGIGRVRWVAHATAAICIGGHLAIAIPIIAGLVEDRGLMPIGHETTGQLIVSEALMLAILASGYALARWARSTATTALAELHSAMRIIGDQQQALAEVVVDVARAKQVNEGRWTGQQMGSFKLGLVLGRGAMGEVYEATGPTGTAAAVKLLNARSTGSSSLVSRFHREMDVAARLESPHIVKVFELSSPDALVPYIAMERLHGVDLATKLRGEPRMPSDELVVLVDHVARGLEVARLAGVVHRDLKPHNVFLHDGTWKILDFGVSKVMDSEGTLTGEGIVGTPQYMAPEQASGGTVTHLADVYALGAIAYRCLTGRSPFRGKDLAELVYQVVHAPPLRPSLLGRVSQAVEDVLAIAMAKDPRKRFPSALAFAQAFAAARRGRVLPVEPPPNAWT